MSDSMHLVLGAAGVILACISVGCAADQSEEATESSADELSSLREGVNSKGCKRSAYNCALHPGAGDQRVVNTLGDVWAVNETWLVNHNFIDPVTKLAVVPVLDGNGDEMGRVRKLSFTLNYGQTRRMKDLTWVYALSAGLASGGWVPVDAFVSADQIRNRVGDVDAKGDGLAKLECYEVKSTYPASLDHLKIVKNATDADSEEPNDYLPQVRANGNVYVNLAFSVPGDALGAPAVDMFPAGTKLQRLDVPTWQSPNLPSLDVTLYSKPNGATKYSKADGDMKFIYGYVKSKLGTVRYGWMAYDGLTPAKGCPDR